MSITSQEFLALVGILTVIALGLIVLVLGLIIGER